MLPGNDWLAVEVGRAAHAAGSLIQMAFLTLQTNNKVKRNNEILDQNPVMVSLREHSQCYSKYEPEMFRYQEHQWERFQSRGVSS
jgi:hypothetical protein